MMGNKEEKEPQQVSKLCDIQRRLNAPKGQYNSFGKYSYRNCEDILEAVKPLLHEHGLTLSLTDTIEEISGRVYVKATAQIRDGEECIESSAYAREPESKKGMDEMQITGAASSYARKYALCGLFAIDDNKDADSMDNRTQAKPAAKPEPAPDDFIEVPPERMEAYNKIAEPEVKKKLKSRLVAICNKKGAPASVMRDWIMVSFGKPFDDMTSAEQANVVATAEREFHAEKVEVA